MTNKYVKREVSPPTPENGTNAGSNKTKSTSNTAEGSRLLSLPRELRDFIWELAVTEHQSVRIKLRRSPEADDNDPLPSAYQYSRIQPAITMTCRQVRAECLAMFFEKNSFCFVFHTGKH